MWRRDKCIVGAMALAASIAATIAFTAFEPVFLQELGVFWIAVFFFTALIMLSSVLLAAQEEELPTMFSTEKRLEDFAYSETSK